MNFFNWYSVPDVAFCLNRNGWKFVLLYVLATVLISCKEEVVMPHYSLELQNVTWKITDTSAVVSGTLPDTYPITSLVVVYDQQSAFTQPLHVQAVVSKQHFEATLPHLSASTNYYVRYQLANALNSAWATTNSEICTRTPHVTLIVDNDEQEGHYAVDMGTDVLWATCNLGAELPEQYGGYYSYAELIPRTVFSEQSYRFYDTQNKCYTKYCAKVASDGAVNYAYYDGLSELLEEDDAAYQQWGASWRIPSLQQWYDLLAVCDAEQYVMNGVLGTLLTSNVTGETLFIPTAGSYASTLSHENGNYQTRSLASDNNEFYCMIFLPSICTHMSFCRCGGYSIRAVCTKS